jgi:hypothetical protein
MSFPQRSGKKLISNSEFNDAFERAETKSEASSLINLGNWLLNKPFKPKD